jgi:hypothetical protein
MTQYEPAFLAEMIKERIQQRTTPSLMVINPRMPPPLRSGDQVGLMEDYASQS